MDARTPPIGRIISHYVILDLIGRGGMGEVYRAQDIKLPREVAIKLLPQDVGDGRVAPGRFEREAAAVAMLNHPNIVTIHEFGTDGETQFMVMEYIRGKTLAELLQGRRLSVEEVLQWAIPVADALQQAHKRGVIHRDLKPGNVMVTPEGVVKVLDFGLAKQTDVATVSSSDPFGQTEPMITRPGVALGTLAYMSPEQSQGRNADARSDVFSFGVMLFEMLSGQRPFVGGDVASFVNHLNFSAPRNVAEFYADTPLWLVDLVEHMIAKLPEDRMQSMAAVAERLRLGPQGTTAGVPVRARIAGLTVRRMLGRHQQTSLIVGAVLLLVIAGLSWAGLRAGWPHRLPPAGDPFALLQAAREDLRHYDKEGRAEHAVGLLKQAIAVRPDYAAAYAGLTEAYYRRFRETLDHRWLDQAQESSDTALRENSELAASHAAKGLVEFAHQRMGSAEKEFMTAENMDLNNGEWHFWQAVVYDATNQQDRASAELAQAQRLQPDDWKIWLEQGQNQLQSGQFDAAAKSWERALQLEPDNVLALRNLGGAYIRLERYSDAASILQQALAIRDHPDTWINLGAVRFLQRRYEEAARAFQKGIDLESDRFEDWGALGDAYRWQPGRSADSIQAFQHAIRLLRPGLEREPARSDLRALAANYLAKSGDKSGALAELARVESIPQKNPDVLLTEAVAYEVCGQRSVALDRLKLAMAQGLSLTDMRNDPDLDRLRQDEGYIQAVASRQDSLPPSNR